MGPPSQLFLSALASACPSASRLRRGLQVRIEVSRKRNALFVGLFGFVGFVDLRHIKLLIFRELKPLLVQLTTDKTAAASTRAAAATSLAGLCFLGGGEMAEVSFSSMHQNSLMTYDFQRFLYIIYI